MNTTRARPDERAERTDRLGEILVRSGRITSAQLNAALELKHKRNLLIGQALVEFGAITESELSDALHEQGKLACIRLTSDLLDPEVARQLDPATAMRLSAIPVNRIAGISTVAMADPMDLNCVDEIAQVLKTRILPVHAEPSQINDCIAFLHSDGGREQRPVVVREDRPEPVAEEPHLARSVVNMVNKLLMDALETGATSVHVEPRRQGFSVRLRVDGRLTERLCLDGEIGPACVARLKWTAGLDLSESRHIQEGSARMTVLDRSAELRVATTPGLEGEGVVIRILEGDQEVPPLDSLGLEPGLIAHLREMLSAAEGLLLVTGPEGSGRTDLLYSILRDLNQPQRKLVSLEDPVHRVLEGVTQIAVDAGFGLDLASGLRSVLRQDPDVVLVGALRNTETAVTAARAALSGRMLLSTLETTGTSEAIQRLLHLGIEPELLADALRGVIAQRSVRSICRKCQMPEQPQPELFQRLGCRPFETWRGAGCDLCRQTGYLGRTVMRELLPMTPGLRRTIRRAAGLDALREAARADGGPTLRADGLRLVRIGATTLQEVLEATDARP